ncbi:MAG: hypothetical protein HYZ53_25190 [Planctomycetes bacterium]|nr:hypothetical protein [Planctomycetota bacterium]
MSTQPAAPLLGGRDAWPELFYRFSLRVGLLGGLLFGAGWGAYFIVHIAGVRAFFELPRAQVLAHAHAALFGCVAPLVFAYGFLLSRRKGLLGPAALACYLPAVLARIWIWSVAGQTVGHHFRVGVTPVDPIYMQLGLLAGGLEAISAGILLLLFWDTPNGGKAAPPFQRFLQWAFLLFFVQTLYDPAVYYLYCTAENVSHTSETAYLRIILDPETGDNKPIPISAFMPPLRLLQLNGFCILLLLGIGQRVLPAAYGAGTTGNSAAGAGLLFMVLATMVDVVVRIIQAALALPVSPLVADLCGPIFYLGVVLVIAPWNLFRKLPREDHSLRFHRAALFWLHVYLLMYILGPIYLADVRGRSPAYHGATVHAMVGGFLTLSLMGYLYRAVPLVAGLNPTRSRWSGLVLALVNVGCAIHVVTQVLSDEYRSIYELLGLGGVLELTAMALWAGEMYLASRGVPPKPEPAKKQPASAKAAAPAAAGASPAAGPAALDPLRRALDSSPSARAALAKLGLPGAELPSPPPYASWMTLREACGLSGVDEAQVLAVLNPPA